MRPSWRRFQRLSPLERSFFLRAVCLLPVTACALRFVGWREIRYLLGSRGAQCVAQGRGDAAEKWRIADAAARMTEAASRYGIVRGKCLSKSIVICRLLHAQGLQATVQVGGRKEGRLFEAHAWVEIEGRTINDSEQVRQRFVPFGGQVSGALTRDE